MRPLARSEANKGLGGPQHWYEDFSCKEPGSLVTLAHLHRIKHPRALIWGRQGLWPTPVANLDQGQETCRAARNVSPLPGMPPAEQSTAFSRLTIEKHTMRFGHGFLGGILGVWTRLIPT